MRSRILGAVLVALGVLALVFAGGLGFVVAPTVERLPYDMERTQSVAEAPNATFMQITNGTAQVKTGTLRSTVTVQPDAKATADLEGPLDGEALVWLVGQEVVDTATNQLVLAYSTSLAVDRRTAAAQEWDKDWLDTGSNRQPVDYAGQIYKFPFGTEKKDYEIFDRDILGTQPARFIGTEQIEGLETYQFTQEIRDGRQNLPADRLSVITSQLLPGKPSAEVVYNNTRTVWVEPTTGQFIRVQEQQNKQLTAPDGTAVTILDATFTYTPETVASAAETATANRQRLNLVTLWAPLGLAVLGLVLLVAGVLMVARRRTAAPAARVPAQRDSSGRHAVGGDTRADTAPAGKGRRAD